MCFSMQAFLNTKSELAAEKALPPEVTDSLSRAGFPAVKGYQKIGSPAHGETFLVQFSSAVPAVLAPARSAGDRAQAVLQIFGAELGSSPFFSTDATASVALVQRALAAAGEGAPKLWLSGELVRRGALRRLPWVLLERVPDTPAQSGTASAVGSSLPMPASDGEAKAWLPRYDDAFLLLAELRRLAISAGATELDAPLARLSLACRDQFKLAPGGDTAASPAAIELEASAAPADASTDDANFGSMAPWAAAAAGDPRIADEAGEPWDLVRAFSDVVKARWLMDLLRRTPGDAPRCDMPVLLKAHDAAQVLLVARGWLPAAIIAPGSSSARLSETFPEEMCPHY